jgi:thymidylate synthase (FAD)
MRWVSCYGCGVRKEKVLMFKTIEQCRLDLVAYTVKADGWNEDSVDTFPASAARVSFGKEDKTGENPEADVKLMKYLAKHKHMSPFEHQSATFLIECPLFIRSQIHRHRTFAYNEISRRYTEENLEFWIPTTWRKQSKSNRQASDGDLDLDDAPDGLLDAEYANDMERALRVYEYNLKCGVAREQARAVLPQSLLTKFYMTGNLRNWAHFVSLRTHEGAQQEVMVVANRISDELRKLWPTAWGVLMDD